MDPVSAVASVTGLLGSLDAILRTLGHLTYSFLPSKKEDSYAHAEFPWTKLSQDLAQVRSSLDADLKHGQAEELLYRLQSIEQDLDNLQEKIRSMVKYRRIRLLGRLPRRRDMEAAMTSILLAKNVIRIIMTLQELDHSENMFIDSFWSHNQAPLERLTKALEPKHHFPLLEPPSTKTQELFALIAGPEEQRELHEQCRAERFAGTCEWFLAREEYQSWLRRDDARFWCRGRPGIGKTMLASKVIDQLQPLHVVAYFYMSSVKSYSASDVVTSLLRQLCLPFHIVPYCLQRIFEKSDGEPGYKLELEDSLEALREVSLSIHQPIAIIIDGLDEINIQEPSDFVQVFNSLRVTSWKCLVTSRGTQYVSPKAYNRFSEYFIEDHANDEDISNFVKCALKQNKPVDRMLDADREFRDQLINTLTSRANGMFYWVTLQIRLILDQTHLAGIRCALDSIPNDIRGIVNITLKMIKLQDEHRANLANQALALLTAAQAPLTADAMCHVLGLANVLDDKERPPKLDAEDIPNAESVIECSMGLIKIEPTTTVVTLAHFDILQELKQEWIKFFSPEHKVRLAKTCIAYLSLGDFSGGPCHEMGTLKRRLEEHPFLVYASNHWGYHARAAQADVIDDVYRFLKQRMNVGLSLQVFTYDTEGKQKRPVIEPDHFLGVSELQIASRHGLTAVVERILKDSQDSISNADCYGRTALHEAAQAGWVDIVSILINAGADPSSMDNEKETPFEYAAKSGHGEVIKILKDCPGRGGYDQQAFEEGQTLERMLYNAAEAGDFSVVEKLLNFPVNPNAKKFGVSALAIAARRGHRSIVRSLLKKKASASHDDCLPSDSIPLHQAIRNSHVEIAALLLTLGANVDARDDLGRTALFETLHTPDLCDLRGATLLLKNGIDISLQDLKGNNVLHEAARRDAVEHALRFVDRRIDVNIPNNDGLTALHLAAGWGHYKIVSLLVEKAADVKAHNFSGCASPIYAESYRKQQLFIVTEEKIRREISSILTQEAIPHQSLQSRGDYRSGSYARLLAFESGPSEILHLDQDTKLKKGSLSTTPLMLAAAVGHTRIITLLLKYRTFSDSTDKKPMIDKDLIIAIDLAEEAGHKEIVDLLRRARD